LLLTLILTVSACSTPPQPASSGSVFSAADLGPTSDVPVVEQDQPAADESDTLADEIEVSMDANDASSDEIEVSMDTNDAPADEIEVSLDASEAASAEIDVAIGQSDAPDDVPEVTDTWIAPKGGVPGSNCSGQEGTPACSSDGKLRVECVNGAWTGIQHCGFGLCMAEKSPGGAVLTKCGVPPAKLTALNTACARFLKCFPTAASHEECVRANVYPGPFQAGIVVGVAMKVPDLALGELHAVPDCAQKAATCADLAECLYFFPAQKCIGGASPGGGASQSCDGELGWTCVAAGKALAVNCAAFGTQCAMLSGAPACVKSAPCEGGAKAVTCAGSVATHCVQAGTKVVGLQRDCAVVGKTCSPGAASLEAACNGAVTKPCSFGQGFSAACEGGKTVNCVGGATTTAACPAATSCAVEDQFGLFWPGCPTSQCGKATCTEGLPCAMAAKCNGSEVWYCEQKSPAAFDCKSVGMNCAMAANGPRCQ
jgi:hypothetical protein